MLTGPSKKQDPEKQPDHVAPTPVEIDPVQLVDEPPTAEELETLPRVCDKIPYAIFFIVVAEVAERFTYRSLTGPMQNYIQNPFHDTDHPGALGKGQATATAIGYFFTCWCYLTPIFGAIIADSWLGRLKTILIGTTTATVGVLILFITSIPLCLEKGAGFPGLIVALFIIGLGAGGIKSNVGPLVAEQYVNKKARVSVDSDGRRVIIDPDITIQTIFSRYYWIMNIGACSGLIATWLELRVGFWGTFLIPLCIYAVAVIVLVLGRHKYVTRPAEGSIVPKAVQALWIGFRNNRNMDMAKPSNMMEQSGTSNVSWDDHFVDEIKVALTACRVLPLFWLSHGTSIGNVISLAAEMKTFGLPNDLLAGSVNPLSILILIPIFDRFLYPALRRMNIQFLPITRISFGFLAMSGAIALAAGLQSLVYSSPSESINFFSIFPIYVLTAVSEILAFVSSMEYAYTKAPRSMKSLVASINLLLCAVGSLLGLAISPTSEKPRVMVQFASLSGIMFIAAIAFYVLFSKYNKEEEKMNSVERGTDDDDTTQA
ncbi:putative oligopeptide transporter [Chaetomium strumarium]|uniref:Oligopeptide transporter n=1 Tax=Chaetomium strumarium TaxID=1170767 RepID=A0AAJ0M546_9PEZI|nr:putative oligopeptide transporter [Chaetomium strumarium]